MANLSARELRLFAAHVKQSNLYNADKDAIVEILLSIEQIIALLRSSDVSIERLKYLLGFAPRNQRNSRRNVDIP